MRGYINLKIALRSILNSKVQSLVSILGLGIGLGSIILISLLYMHEISFDKYIPDNNQVYRIIHGSNSSTPFPLGETVKNDIPSVDDFFRYHQSGDFEIRLDGKEIIEEDRFACADASVYNCLGIDFIIGKASESYNEVAISEKMALKYFSDGDALNKTIETRLNNEFIKLIVCGIYKDLPSNASLAPNFISHTDLIDEFLGTRKKLFGEYASEDENFRTNWERDICITYITINGKANPKDVTEKLQKYQDRFETESKKELAFSLQPSTDVYLHSEEISDLYSRRGNANELKYFVAIALFILIIAIFNYIFLTRAKMAERLKELGVKRALGASTASIRKQMLVESNIISILSLIPAIFVVMLGMPFVNSTLGRNLDSQILSLWYTIPLLALIPLLTGTFSGLVVGVKISRISPILLLNNKSFTIPKNKQWSNSFLSLHFAVFIILIVGVFVLRKQINYSLNNFTAINPKNVLICELNTPELSQKYDVIDNYVKTIPGVTGTAGSSFIPPFNWTLPIRLLNPENNETIVFDGLIMGKGMMELLNIELLDGDYFGEFGEGQAGFIFNESAASEYNLKVGEIFNGFYILGIVKDFTAHSMHKLINPMVIIQQHPDKMSLFAIKTTGETDEEIKAGISKLFKEISPDKMVSIYTLQEQINQFYVREQNQAKLISAFSILAIALTIMGLFAMVLNTVSGKTKEIGIRRVNGATVSEIVLMLNKDFLKWVALAFIVASPFAWYIMNKWLENFAYKTTLSWWIFALAGFLAFFIALITVSWHTFNAARRNPVEALRYE
ncbi:MAG: ABC transporter permease [Bacteroidales bacterium]|nr:ABC transporter permease [Bacteroidales bacterium]MCF8390906.1 ABC transporter permease [Bacteroidales bacterium]